MKKFLAPLLFVVIVNTVSAQKFNPGYYVKTSGDTVKTNLFLKTKKGSIISVQSEDGKSLGPADVVAAQVARVTYVVKIVTVDKSPKTQAIVDTLFLEVMSREKISLLYAVDEYEKSHYFIEDEDGTITELGLRLLDKGDGLTFQELPTYKQTLKAFFPGCLADEIDKTRYTKNAIYAIYSDLYHCKYGSAPKMQSSKQVVTDFGVTAGIAITDLTFIEVNGGSLAPHLNFDKSTDFTGGLFAETRFARTGGLFSIRNELTHRKYDVSSKDYYNGQGQTRLFGAVAANYIKYSLLLRVTLSHNTLKPFINVGLSPSFLLTSSNGTTTITGNSIQNGRLLGKVDPLDFGFSAGAGLVYNNFGLEARYEQSTGLNPELCNSKVNTLYVMLSYRVFDGKY